MKITIDKEMSLEQISFRITFTEPKETDFNLINLGDIDTINKCIEAIRTCGDANGQLIGDLVNDLHASRDSRFRAVNHRVQAEIYDMLWKKMPILRETVYNWILDNQTPEMKAFLQQFQVERTTYNFDNDSKLPENYDFDIDDDEDE